MTVPKTPARKATPTGSPVSPVKPATQPSDAHDRRVDDLLDLIGTLAAALMVPAATRADSAALVVHGPALVEGVARWADADQRVARILDKITAMGPASAFVAGLTTLGAQIAVNHEWIPVEAGKLLGAVDADTLMTVAADGRGDDGDADPPSNRTA